MKFETKPSPIRLAGLVGLVMALSPSTGDSATPRARDRVAQAGIELVAIPGGTYRMGRDDGERDERLRPSVTLPAFSLSRSEVTVAQYEHCVRAKACKSPRTGGTCNWGRTDQADHPVNCVTFPQARKFAAWVGGRLPSEAEWEYAARGGGLERKFPWGDAVPNCERTVFGAPRELGCAASATEAVCKRPAGNTAQGLCDLDGNVSEWVEDTYHDSYALLPADGRAWTDASKTRVTRGGGFTANAWGLSASLRDGATPELTLGTLGFRVAK